MGGIDVGCGAIPEVEGVVPLAEAFFDFDFEDFGGLEDEAGVPAANEARGAFDFPLEVEGVEVLGGAPVGVAFVAAWSAAVLILSLTIIGWVEGVDGGRGMVDFVVLVWWT